MRRIFGRLQGVPRGTYYPYVTFGATLKAGKKTSKIADLFISEALISFYNPVYHNINGGAIYYYTILSLEIISNFLTAPAQPY